MDAGQPWEGYYNSWGYYHKHSMYNKEKSTIPRKERKRLRSLRIKIKRK